MRVATHGDVRPASVRVPTSRSPSRRATTEASPRVKANSGPLTVPPWIVLLPTGPDEQAGHLLEVLIQAKRRSTLHLPVAADLRRHHP